MPFEKGNKARLGEKLFKDALRMALSEEGPEGRKKLRLVAEALVDKALEGDVAAIKEIANRMDGMPVQAIEHSGEIGRPLIEELQDGFERARQLARDRATATGTDQPRPPVLN